MTPTNRGHRSAPGLSFKGLVSEYYRPMYKFGLSLTRSESEASDLVQQTFYVWGTKGSQLEDTSKVRTWLFTTLHREFLKTRRKQVRFPEQALDQVEDELPVVDPLVLDKMDAKMVLDALHQVDERYRAPISLFYLEDHPYKEIAEILDIAVGTVQSRIYRGKAQLHKLLAGSFSTGSRC